MRRLCRRNPNERLSAFQALNHPWLQHDSNDAFHAPPQTSILSTYTPPPPCRFASRPAPAGAPPTSPCTTCPIIAKLGFCAFLHPPEDLKPGTRVAVAAGEPPVIECMMAQLSSPAAVLHDRPLQGALMRLLRHNCEGEIGWSFVQIDDVGGQGVREGLVASCCVGLPQGIAAEWEPPTYDVDTHRHPSVFKQASQLHFLILFPSNVDPYFHPYSGSRIISGLVWRWGGPTACNLAGDGRRICRTCRCSRTCRRTTPAWLMG